MATPKFVKSLGDFGRNFIFSKPGEISKAEAQPYRSAFLVGMRLGIVSTVLEVLAISLILVLLPKETAGQSAAAFLSNVGPLGIFFLGVLLIPFWEAFIAQLLPLELVKMMGFGDKACIAVGALVFAAGHYLNGGVGHGLCAAIGGGVFASAYMAMRPCGYFPAFWASYVAHAFNNVLFLYLVPLTFRGLG
ncbi:type II CAAX prenyl endopeptidase Rce1 family protein [Janthinobacterium sp.]|uniref:CPBP family glutamic-type intramembrane protease n=1 Tax=Janthinobacterium sp. TaxID=1871054 RepID=UPI00293D275C|nr:CPBP family glutamic-type intramembrane protease [Janthinobacterium sp.]